MRGTICGPGLPECRALHDAGVAVEVSTMYISGRESEVCGAAERIRAISPGIPFQVMRFVATHENLSGLQPDRSRVKGSARNCAGHLTTCTCSTRRQQLNSIPVVLSAARLLFTGSSSGPWPHGFSPVCRTGSAAAGTVSPAGGRSSRFRNRPTGPWRLSLDYGCEVYCKHSRGSRGYR